MANERCIRDPIHNYIYLTNVEAQLVKHELFQRLRFISQNGAAYYTYPSNKSCRFLHSLGCMKLGGDIFLNATEDFYDAEVRQYLSKAYEMIDEITSEQLAILESTVKAFITERDKTFIKYGLSLWENEKNIKENKMLQMRFARAVMFQSLRIACLLHDIGHFPFSHAVERAFGQYFDYLSPDEKKINETYKKLNSNVKQVEKEIHERIGIEILKVIMPSDETAFHKLCRIIATKILTGGDTKYNNIVHMLHTIVSSQLDADRLDYCLRDPKASGLEFGAFDIERLTDSFTICLEKDEFKILPNVSALSSIESFYHQRFLIYKYLIYHHSKARMDEIVKEITFMLIEIYNSESYKYTNIKKILEDNKFYYLWKKCSSTEYYYCNENWYFTMLQGIYIIINTYIDSYVERLKLLIETFIFRKTNNIYSFFKRYDAYFSFLEDMYAEIKEDAKEDFNDYQKKMQGIISDAINNNFLKDIKEGNYRENAVICLIVKTPPKIINPGKGQKGPSDDESQELKVVQIVGENKEKKLFPIMKFSPYLESMLYASENEQFFNIFLIKADIKDDINGQLLENIRGGFSSFFVKKYKEEYKEAL